MPIDVEAPTGPGLSEMNPIAKLILQIGVPSAIALYLVYLLGGSLSGEMRTFSEKLDSHMSATTVIRESLQEQNVNQKLILDVLRQTCVNAAKTTPERNACWGSR